MAEMLRRVAVLIVSYNTVGPLREALAALSNASLALEVVVVDNGSTDGSAEAIEADFPWARLVRAPGNIGFGAGINVAARHTDRDFLLILNPDCVITPQDTRAMAMRLDADPALGYVGPRVDLASGDVDHAALRADPDVIGSALYLSRVTRLFPDSGAVNRYSLRHLDYDQEQPLLAGTGACLLVRASAFAEVGGFDESFFMYGEDLDLCRRLRAAGYKGLYMPSARAVHLKGEASQKQSRAMLVEFHKSMWTYYRKHEARRRPWVVSGAVAAGIAGVAAGRLALNAVRREKRVSSR
ncbi:MAG: hypothetical protein QOE92_366 [Chloroflexota bacterium]|jgi:GT2 family glycosyltransferase|nr:hypothetical protein [Chloroflexota bacterium]